MRVIARRALQEFARQHPSAAEPLRAWFHEARTSSWAAPEAIRRRYRSADILSSNRVVFDIGGNKYRLVVKVAYRVGIGYIRFIGTHAEYDRIDAESI